MIGLMARTIDVYNQ